MSPITTGRLKSQKTFKKLTRKTRYGFLKRQTKLKYRHRDNLDEREKRRHERQQERQNLQYKAHVGGVKKKDIIFTFRKGAFPIRASFAPISKPVYDRSLVITENYKNRIVSVFNGMLYFNYKIPQKAIGSKFGELSPTKQWKVGSTHTKRKKVKKSPKGAVGVETKKGSGIR